MVKTVKQLVIISLLTSVIYSISYSYQVTVQNLVGISTTSSIYTSVPLPSKVKANSNYIPIARINFISLPAESLSGYYIKEISVTVQNVSNFDAATDLLPLSSNGIALFADSTQSNVSTNTWDGISNETEITTTKYPATWAECGGPSSWTVKLTPTVPNQSQVSSTGNNYTFYICIKTNNSITNNDKFRIRLDGANDLLINFKDASYYSLTPIAVSTITADTVAPVLQPVYSLNPTNGTSLTVKSSDTYNIYSTTDITTSANNKINIKVTLDSSATVLTDNFIYALNDLFILDTDGLDLNAGSVTCKQVTAPGASFEYSITYALQATNVNSPITPIPFKIKVKDAAGNESSVDSLPVFIDRAKPNPVVINSPADGSWIGDTKPQFSWTQSDDPNLLRYYLVISTAVDLMTDFKTNGANAGLKIKYRNLGNIINTTLGNTWTAIGDGTIPVSSTNTYYTAIAAEDKAGNISLTSSYKQYKYDNTPPSIFLSSPIGNLTTSLPTISTRIDDSNNGALYSGIDFSSTTLKIKNQSVIYSTAAADVSSTSISITYVPTIPLIDGAYDIVMNVTDNAGVSASKTWNLNIDTVKPESKDTDNDGYTDYNETRIAKTDPNNANSVPAGAADFFPLQGQYVNSDYVSKSSETIKFRVDDSTAGYSAGIDTTSIVNSIFVSHTPKGSATHAESYILAGAPLLNTDKNTTMVTVQLTQAMLGNGNDDGVIQISYPIVDVMGNSGGQVTRSFIYDTTKPVLSTVTAPSAGDTQTPVTFTVQATDNYEVTTATDGVILQIYNTSNNNIPYIMTLSGNGQYTYNISLQIDGIYYYYFTYKDKAGNSNVYPPNADTNKNFGLPLVISDKTAPQGTILNIQTLVNYQIISVTTTYTSTASGNKHVKSVLIPVIYSNPASDNTSYYNVMQVTAPVETTSISVEYSTLGSATWNAISSIYKTATTDGITGNPVWQINWNTSALPVETYYNIRVITGDQYGNSYTPQTNAHSGWAVVYLKSALAPKAVINTGQNFPVNAGAVSGTKLLLNASTNTTSGNLGTTEVAFQYKKISDQDSGWQNIAIDSDSAISTSLTSVTFKFNESELPYIIANNVDISTIITSVKFDEQNFGNKYDAVMAKSGSVWSVTMALPVGNYKYQFTVTTPKGDFTITRDPREYGLSGSNSSIVISPFSYEWDTSNLINGQEYSVRAVAKDGLGNQDASSAFISFTYDNTAAISPSFVSPLTFERIRSGINYNITLTFPNSVTVSSITQVVYQYSDDMGVTWKPLGKISGAVNWTLAWTVPSLLTETTYFIRAHSWKYPPNISAPVIVPVIIDPVIPQVISFWAEKSTPTVVLESGKEYTLKATSLDYDVLAVTFTATGGIKGNFNPISGIVQNSAGAGTNADPYVFSCAFTPTNIDSLVSGTLNAIILDIAGNSSQKTINVQIKDVTPTIATLNKVSVNNNNWLPLTNGWIVGNDGVFFSASISNFDSSMARFQFSTSNTGPWTDIGGFTTITTNTVTSIQFIPSNYDLTEGIYYVRCIATDNDNNVDPNPNVVSIVINYNYSSIPVASINQIKDTGIVVCYADSAQSQIRFEYRVPGSTWASFGIGNPFQSPVSLSILPAGTYELRAVAQNAAGKEDLTRTPVVTCIITVGADGKKYYQLNRTTSGLIIGVSDVKFISTSDMEITLRVESSVDLAAAPVAVVRLTTDLVGETCVTLSGLNSSTKIFTGIVRLSGLTGGANQNIAINVTGKTSANQIVGESTSLVLTTPGTTPGATTADGLATVGVWTGTLPTNDSILISPVITPAIPATQASLLGTVSRTWDFKLASGLSLFPAGTTAKVTLTYSDADYSTVTNEDTLGIAYYDESKGMWSSEGITSVAINKAANTINFNTSHFSKFGIMAINSTPVITFKSPANAGYADKDPLIYFDMGDDFSGIGNAKVEIDGIDQTVNLLAMASIDGIDNNGNGTIDEKDNNGINESAVTQLSNLKTRFMVRALIGLNPGEHVLRVSATNQQSRTSTQNIKFTVGSSLSFVGESYNYPNPFKPTKREITKIIPSLSKQANVTVTIYDFAGDKVATIEKELFTSSDEIIWDGTDDETKKPLADGVYFARIDAKSNTNETVTKYIKIAVTSK